MIVHQFLQWLGHAPAGQRAEATHALVRAYLHSDVDEETRSGMEAAMTVLLDDPSPGVRFALADALASSPDVPRHILLTLAGDRPDIAAAVLSRSPAFSDSELVEIAAAAGEPLQAAIAARPGLSGAVAAAIAEVGEEMACSCLLANAGASVARISLRRIAERFGHEPRLREMLLDRADLSPDIRQMLVRRISEALGAIPVVRGCVGEERTEAVVHDACERATVAIAAESATEDLVPLVEHLRVTEQLTTALLLRAVCAGNIAFFEAALSVLAEVPEERVASMVRSGRLPALRAVYDRAGLPAVAFDAFWAAVEACRRLEAEGPIDRYRFTRTLVDAVLSRYGAISDGEMSELAAMLRRFAAEQSRDAARAYARLAAA